MADHRQTEPRWLSERRRRNDRHSEFVRVVSSGGFFCARQGLSRKSDIMFALLILIVFLIYASLLAWAGGIFPWFGRE